MLSLVEESLLAVVAVFVAVAVGFNAVTFLIAFAVPRATPRPPLGNLLSAFFKEVVATLFLIPLWPLFSVLGARYAVRVAAGSPVAASKNSTAGRDGVPVVLLHGYLMNRTNWLWFGRELSRRGIGPITGFGYLTLGSIERSARRLGRHVERVCADEGVEKVDLVGHSMGGLVARFYIEHLGGAPRVRRLVTIATPHRGTAWARVAPGFARSHLNHGLRHHGFPADGPRYTAVWSRCDNLVVPPESAAFPVAEDPSTNTAGAETPVSAAELEAELEATASAIDDFAFDDLGHLGLLVSPRVADVVAERLTA